MNDRATELTVGASRSSTVSNNCYKKKESQKGISKGVYETHETQLHCTVVRLVLQKRRDLLRCKGKKTPHYEKKKNSSQPNKKLRASSKNRISGGSPVELVDERESQKVYMISTLTTLHSGKTTHLA